MRRKLTLVIMLTSAIAVLMVIAAAGGYEFHLEKEKETRFTVVVCTLVTAALSSALVAWLILAQFQASDAKLRELEERLLEVTDREQARIGQDIHDGLSQHLLGVALNVALLKEDILAGAQPGIERADMIGALLDRAIGEARTLARGLYPVTLLAEGLFPALQELAMNVAAQSEIVCLVECSELITLDDRTEAIHLYRIAQEAINNALKHACATRVTILLAVDEDQMRLSVCDDGIGMSADASERCGMGLRSMRYRAAMIGGRLTIQTNRARGTIVSCIFRPKIVKENLIQKLNSGLNGATPFRGPSENTNVIRRDECQGRSDSTGG